MKKPIPTCEHEPDMEMPGKYPKCLKCGEYVRLIPCRRCGQTGFRRSNRYGDEECMSCEGAGSFWVEVSLTETD